MTLSFHEIALDSRARHRVFANGNVRIPYGDWEISVAADGADIIAHGPADRVLIYPANSNLLDDLVAVRDLIDNIYPL